MTFHTAFTFFPFGSIDPSDFAFGVQTNFMKRAASESLQ
jgi:hypothetical protein